MSAIFEQPDDAATPLSEEEKRGLKLSYITTRSELNAAEQENIARAQEWALLQRHNIITESFIIALHRKMLSDVWQWAGKYRTSELNIGINPYEIPVQIRVLIDDAKVWVDENVFSSDEIAVRFHHRLTQIHPFPNGNGRHARLIADLLVMQLSGQRFTWGQVNLRDASETRRNYIAALKEADKYDIGPLLAFARM